MNWRVYVRATCSDVSLMKQCNPPVGLCPRIYPHHLLTTLQSCWQGLGFREVFRKIIALNIILLHSINSP